MKRWTFILFALALFASQVYPQARPGGIAREIAMGGSNAGTNLVLNPFIMDDPAILLLNPAYQGLYRDYGWANIAGGSITGLSGQPAGSPAYGIGDDGYGRQNAGVGFGINDQLSLGAVLSYDPSAINALVNSLIIGRISQRPPQTIPYVGNVWEVLGSYRLNSSDVIGLGMMYGWSNHDSVNTAADPRRVEGSASVWGIRGGFVCELATGSTLEASAALRLDRTTDDRTTSAGTDGKYSTSGTEFQLDARAKLNMSAKFNLVPYGSLTMVSAEPKEEARPLGITTATDRSLRINYNAYALGIGGEYRTQTLYMAGGVSWRSQRNKLETTIAGATETATATATAIPVINVGAEWWYTDWLAGRIGYYRASENLNTKEELGAAPANNAEGNLTIPNSVISIGALGPGSYDGLITLGVGLKFGGASLDATVSDAALRRGLGLVGSQDAINTFGYLTASYNFAE